MALKLDQLDGKYEIIEKIREGGMGAVYKVRHRLLEELRVIKVMRPHLADDEVLQARFLREAKVAVRLRHPNLAQIYDFTVDDQGYAFLVMEYIDGLNLQDMVRVLRTPSIGLVVEIARQTASALGYLHRKGIVHRDVSPDNLLVTRDDDRSLHVKLIDLGIAKTRAGAGDENLTSAGTFVGKVRYSSPEHFRTQDGAEVDQRSDLYSFGVVLYEGLTGKYPIRGKNVSELVAGHLMNPPRDFGKTDPEGRVPDELRAIAMKCLAKRPEDRFESAEDLIAALDSVEGIEPVSAEELQALFETPALPTQKMSAPAHRPGSTQDRINQNFGISSTPSPGESDATFETSGTVETGSRPGQSSHAGTVSKVKALVDGARRLVEGHHFDEARAQIALIKELDPDNPTSGELLAAIEVSDTMRRREREDRAAAVRERIAAEEFERAAELLEAAVDALGGSDLFDAVGRQLADAVRAREEAVQRARKLADQARSLLQSEDFDGALASIEEAREADPRARNLDALAQEVLQAKRTRQEKERREREIVATVATIRAHVQERDPDEAATALTLARGLYGDDPRFATLEGEIETARDRLRREQAADLREQGRSLVEARQFDEAITSLEESYRLDADQSTAELLTGAREGLRLQEQARRRREAVDAARLEVDRLILAGRLQSASRRIDRASSEIADLEEADGWRRRVAEETAARDAAEATLRDALERSEEQARSGAFAAAASALDEARALLDDHPEFGDRIRSMDETVHAIQEERRRQQALDELEQRMAKHLADGAIDEARRELDIARRLFGGAGELDDLQERVNARERDLLHERVTEIVNRALSENRGFDETMADLERALALDPDNARVTRLLEETREAQTRHLAEQRAREIEKALTAVDVDIAAGRITEALRSLDGLVERFGEFPEARGLKHRLSKMQGA